VRCLTKFAADLGNNHAVKFRETVFVLMTLMLPVDQLKIGMYVAQLDRPWLDTPFLFQGFYIRDADEINELKEYCEHVFVDKESLTGAPPDLGSTGLFLLNKATGEKPGKKRFGLHSLVKIFKKQDAGTASTEDDDVYKITTSLKEETPVASGVHREAIVTVRNVMQGLRSTGVIDMSSLQKAITPMVDSVLRNPAALACLMRMQKKDDYLYHHSIASTVWATILGRQIGLRREDLDVIALGAMLLDVGKTQVPIELLTRPAELNDTEMDLMRRHVEFGLKILNEAGDVDKRVIEMVANHHERYNGTGYPAGLQGNTIPVFGRIAGIVDAYDAMITTRPYAQLMSSFDALRALRLLADVEFQAEIIEQFIRAIGVFPTGTLVELNTGEVAIVTGQNRIRRLRPQVMVIMGPEKQLLDEFRVVNLNEEKTTEDGTHSIWISHGLPPGSHGIDPTEFYLD